VEHLQSSDTLQKGNWTMDGRVAPEDEHETAVASRNPAFRESIDAEEIDDTFDENDADRMEQRNEQLLVEIFAPQLGGIGVRVVENQDPTSKAARDHQTLQENLRARGATELAEMLKSLHIAHLNMDLESEFKEPDLQAAKEWRNAHHPRAKNDPSLEMSWACTSTGSWLSRRSPSLIRFGPGISSYFKMLKLLFWMFVALFFFQIPIFTFNINTGSFFGGALLPFGETTIGNLFRPNASEPLVVSRNILCREDLPPGYEGRCATNSETVAMFYGVMDALTSLVFLLFMYWLRRGTKNDKLDFKEMVHKLEHYSILVRNIPEGTKVGELGKHFEKLTRGKVVDVQLVSATNNALALCVERGRALQKMARANARNMRNPNRRDEKRFERSKKAVQKLDQKAYESAQHGKPLFAFVTFDRESDRKKCLHMYEIPSFTCSQMKKLRLGGLHPLKVEKAPPPSSLIWENNEFSSRARRFRGWLTSLLMLALLMITVSINYFGDRWKVSKNVAELVSGSGTSIPCGGLFSGIDEWDTALVLAQSTNGTADPSRGEDFTFVDCLCENAVTGNLDFSNEKLGSDCASTLSRRVRELFLQVFVSFATLLMNTAVFLVLSETAIYLRHSSLLTRELQILRRLAITSYLNVAFLILVVNTDLSGAFGIPLSGATERLFGSGEFVDFSPDWYRVAGFEILLLALGNIFAPHFFPLLLALYTWLSRKVFFKPTSHAELKESILGPDFLLSYRLSQQFVMVALIFSYSTGLPILLPVGAISVFFSYWVDKFFFMKICSLPFEFSSELQEWTNNAMQWVVVLHLCFGIWMLSNDAIFPKTEGSQFFEEDTLGIFANFGGLLKEVVDRFTRRSSIPNLVVLLCFLSFKLLSLLNVHGGRILKGIWFYVLHCLEHWLGESSDAVEARRGRTVVGEVIPTFTEAKNSGSLSGIKSYFILENPRYQRYFPEISINEKFGDLGDAV